MGAVCSFILSSTSTVDPAMDVPDPAIGLTPRQKLAIVNSWALVKKDIRGNGIGFFMALFREYPQYQKMFRRFSDVPRSELPKNKRLQAHAFNVMNSIDQLVENLDDVECLSEMLFKIGLNHGRRGLDVQDFQNLKGVLLEFLCTQLGDNLNEEGKEAWNKVLTVMIMVFEEGIKESVAELDSGWQMKEIGNSAPSS